MLLLTSTAKPDGRAKFTKLFKTWGEVREVLDAMKQLVREGMTMLVVTHEMGFAREVAHRVVFMDEGRILETGSPQDLFDRPQNPRTQSFLSKIL